MKTSIRWWSRLALVAGMGLSTLVACSSDQGPKTVEEQRTGTLTLPLRTISNTGKVYFLRNATFQLQNFNTGNFEFISTEDGFPDSGELSKRLESGFYQITLLDGWFLERFDPNGNGGGTGGVAGGGMGTAGKAPFPEGGESSGGMSGPKKPLPPPPQGAGGEGDEGPFEGGAPGAGGSTSAGGSIAGGAGPIGGTGGKDPGSGGGEIVTNGFLPNGPTQFVQVSPQSENFVNYAFRVGDDFFEFNKGNLHLSFTVDDVPLCTVPADATRVDRVLMETNSGAFGSVSLRQVFQALATNGGHSGDSELLFNQVWDSFASGGNAQIPTAVHCGDETTPDGQPSFNGYPIDCDRSERFHVNGIDGFFPTAFVNRIDLAPASGAHCGQQRMIFASNSQNRAFMILEAQIPNPHPELGIDGCRPLAQFWMDQNNIPDAKERGLRLQQAFLTGGAKGLEEFGPFYTAENLTVGSGQIRTNQFDSSPWTLREFKLALDGANLAAVPFPVAESPNEQLWNENNPLPQGESCRQSFLSALDGVLTNDMSIMSFVVDSACKNSESRERSENYAAQLSNSPGLQALIEDKLASVGSPLTANDIANRAHFAGSCMGCHQEARGTFLGNGVFSPTPSDFPQVVEFTEQCGDNNNEQCFAKSPALKEVFLPGRLRVLSNLLGVEPVPNPCDGNGGGVGGSPGAGGSFTMGGSFPIPTAGTGPTMGPIPVPEKGLPAPAPVIEIDLPSVDEPVAQMQEEEQEIRSEYGDVTISGKSAASTH